MATNQDILYQLSHIRKTYSSSEKGRYALDIERLAIPRNQVVVIVGESGSGKTTLLNLLGLLDLPDSQYADNAGVSHTPQIVFNLPANRGAGETGRSLDLIADRAELGGVRRSTFGFIFQEDYLLKNISSKSNIKIPLLINGLDSKKSPIDNCLTTVGLEAAEYANRLPVELSGGQAQRVAIIRSIIHNPRVIIADEPSSRLDRDHGWQIMQLLVDWCHGSEGRSLIWVTHNLELAANLGDHIIILKDGKVVVSQPNLHRSELTLLRWSRMEPGDTAPDTHPADEDHPATLNRTPAPAASGQDASFWKNIPVVPVALPWLQHVRSVLFFACSDLFPPATVKSARTAPVISPFMNFWRSLLGVRKTQGLNILSLFMILLLALFFANISFWLKNYFVWSVSDPRMNNITVTGRTSGDPVLNSQDMQKLSTLTWARDPKSNESRISWAEEIERQGLQPGHRAILGAYGSRDRALDFYFNTDSEESRSWDDLAMIDVVAMDVRDPILAQIELWTGDTISAMQPGNQHLDSLFAASDGSVDTRRGGVIITRESLEMDLGYKNAIPATLKMNHNATVQEFPLLGVSDWLPFGARIMISSGWYENNFLTLGQGDPMPGYDRITIYIQDMLGEGLPLANALSEMRYRTKSDIKSRLTWIKNLTDFIAWSAFLGVIGIAFLVAGTLMVSYTQAIQKKQQEIGLLLAHGIPRTLLLVIFLVEIFIVWAIAAALVLPTQLVSGNFLRQIMIEKFELHMNAAQIFHIPGIIYWLILGGSLFLAWLSVTVAVNRTINRPIADILKTTG